MPDRFTRTELLLGKKNMEILAASRVAVFGLGGVGGCAAEALVRGGVGNLDLIDHDTVCLSNLNRQILATEETVGEYKADAAARRFAEINPKAKIETHKVFYSPETANQFDFSSYDYIVDAIDSVAGKIALAENAYKAGTRIISCMGAGNKMDPTLFEVTDLYKTSVCPLARVMRYELKRRGIPALKVVYSKEKPLVPQKGENDERESARRQTPGSVSFVPPAAGLILAGEVIRDLIRWKER